MNLAPSRRRAIATTCLTLLLGLCVPSFAKAQKRIKLPRPVRMDAGVRFERNAKTGELTATKEAENDTLPSGAAIRVHSNMVEVSCNVFAADATAVRGLTQTAFRVFDDGAEQQIAHFGASSQGASIALVIDASPSVLPDSSAMRAAARQLIANLSPADEVAVVDFSEHTFLLLPFSRDRAKLEKAIEKVNVQNLFYDTGGSNIYHSVYLAAQELFPGRGGRKAIILLTDGQDSGLGLNLDGAGVEPRPGELANRMTLEDVAREVASNDIELDAISTQNRPLVMTPGWLEEHRDDSLVTPAVLALGIPAYTDFLAELVRRVGGRLYFLNETGSIAGAYRRIVQHLSAEYTLGFYPPEDEHAGWHKLRVQVAASGAARVIYRDRYYSQAEAQ